MNKDQALNSEVVVKFAGRDFTLALDFNALPELEVATGENPLSGAFWQKFLKGIGPTKLRLFFWATARSHHPELSLTEAGKLLSLANGEEIKAAVPLMLSLALGNENSKKNSSKRQAERKETVKLTGSSSGQPEDTVSGSPTESSDG